VIVSSDLKSIEVPRMAAGEPTPPAPALDEEIACLQRELIEAHKTIRALLRQVSKEQARNAELVRAYNLTVENLVQVTRENTKLSRELDTWRARVECGSRPFIVDGGAIEMTAAEISAIRRAMARLHHPDTGGDAERMKTWNSLLDPLENA
jgi:hypothetical protein